MKGFMKDKKFHPITPSKGIRKSRDQKTKTSGVKVRKGRWDNNNQYSDVQTGIMIGGMRGIDWANRQRRFAGTKKDAIKSVNKSYDDKVNFGITEEMAEIQRRKDMKEVEESYEMMSA